MRDAPTIGLCPTTAMLVVCVLAGAWLSAASRADEPGEDVRDRIPLKRFVIQAHRGAGVDLPENTLQSYATAWRWGVVPEADVRTSSDGVLCAFHDKDFVRLAKHIPPEWKSKRVRDLTWQELAEIDVGAYAGDRYAGQRIARIEDALAAMAGHPDRRMYLDIKEVSLKKLAALVKKHGVQKQVIFTTPRFDLIRRWKKMVPASQTLLWMGGTEEDLSAKLADLAAADFEGITTLQIHVRLLDPGSSHRFSPSPGFLRDVGRKLRARGITYQALPWDTNDADVYHALLDLGVESFATDHPLVTRKAVLDYYAKRQDGSDGVTPSTGP